MAHLNLNLRAFALLSLCLLANQPSRTFLPVVSGNPDRPPGCSFLLGVSRDPDGLCSYACYCPAAGLVPAGVCYKLQPHLSDHLPLSLPVACSHTTLLLYLLPPCALACLPADLPTAGQHARLVHAMPQVGAERPRAGDPQAAATGEGEGANLVQVQLIYKLIFSYLLVCLFVLG